MLYFYLIGDLAWMLGRQAVTMRKWESEGILPMTPITKKLGEGFGALRLYTRGMILGTVQIAREEGILIPYSGDPKRTNFTARVAELFASEAAAVQKMGKAA